MKNGRDVTNTMVGIYIEYHRMVDIYIYVYISVHKDFFLQHGSEQISSQAMGC